MPTFLAHCGDDSRNLKVDKKLLDILVCPVTKGSLVLDKQSDELVSVAARLAYPIRNGIPVMLEDEARSLSADEADAYRS